MIVKNLYLTKNEPIFFEVAQGAAGVQFGIRVQDYTIPAGAVVNIYVSKPDGTLVYNAAEVSRNTITVTTTTQMTAVVGRSNCQVQVVSTGILLRTFVFALQVKASIIDESAIESTDEFGALETALQTISDYDADILALQTAVSAINGNIGSFKCVSEGLTYIQGETVLEKVQRAYAQEWMPKGIPFIAQITSGSYYIMIGYWYPNSNYGFCYVQNFEDAHFVRLSDNSGTAVWKITSNYSMASSSSVSIKIGSGSSYSGTIARSGKLRVYNFYYEMNSAVGTITLTDPIGTVGDDDKPRNEETAAIVGLTNSSWASTDTYPMAIMIDATGKIYMRGRPSEIALCKAFRGQICWIVP